MASLMTGLWQLAVVMMILFHISASLPSLERNQRQIELKLMHDAGMRREYEKAAKLLQTLMNYKRSVPKAPEEKDVFGFIDANTADAWTSEEKLIKLKTCLQFVQKLDLSFSGNETDEATQIIRHYICQLIAEMSEAASGAATDENQE